jgi:hypothetical protein
MVIGLDKFELLLKTKTSVLTPWSEMIEGIPAMWLASAHPPSSIPEQPVSESE